MEMNKSQLRKHIAELVGRMSSNLKQEQSRILYEKLIDHSKYKEAKTISVYLSTENEVDTIPILRHSLGEGKQSFVPFVRRSSGDVGVGETRMLMVELKSFQDYLELPTNHYGIKEPPRDCTKRSSSIVIADPAGCALDLIIVPGVAFNLEDNSRLGHGKGYYDEFLTHWANELISTKRPYSIGLTFNEQIVDDVLAIDGHDFKLDEVLTA